MKVSPVNGQSLAPNDAALDAYEAGYKYYKLGRFKESEEKLLEALKLEPNLIKAHYWLGKLYREEGRLKDAIFHWEEVDRLTRLIKQRRIALSFSNNEYPAQTQAIKTLKHQKTAQIAFEKGLHFLDKGHWDGAEVEFRKAVLNYPANKEYLRKLARLLWDKSEKQASIKFYRDLLHQKDCSLKDFIEGIDRILATDMMFVAEPLLKQHQARFAYDKDFQKRLEVLNKPIKLDTHAAGKIIKRLDGQVIVNLGLRQGLNLSDEFSLTIQSFQPGQPIIDPDTGNAIGRAPNRVSADLLITKVFKNSSWALIRREFGRGVKAGDLIEIKETIK
jgi:tetratricopeptide (TPR) repeat protein